MTTPPPEAPGTGVSSLYAALRILGLVVLVLMLISIAYSAWIALANWGSISV